MSTPYDLFDYTNFWEKRSFEDKCERIVLGRFFGLIDKKNRLIDIGGGFGRLASIYAPIFSSCTVLEPSIKQIEIGKKKFKAFSNLSFKEGSLPSLPFPDNSFEAALVVRVLHHFESSEILIEEIKRILVPNGYLILEVANKIHMLARLKAFFRGDKSFSQNFKPVDRRSIESIKEKKITFVDHHPKKVLSDLKSSGFSVLEIYSVSNFRSQFLKKTVPEKVLLFLEEKLQKPLGLLFFGPSIFILAKKTQK